MISRCDVWTRVFDLWLERMEMSLEEYKRLRMKFERNKVSLRTFKNKFFPSAEFAQYCHETKKLFLSIRDVTGKDIIVDSSKSPQRIAVLQRVADLHVLHICRSFSGVLNSGKKFIPKNIEAGVEINIIPRRSVKILLDWLGTNILTILFCLGVRKTKIKYAVLVSSPDKIFQGKDFFGLQYHDLLNTEFIPDHMPAGNMIRLKTSTRIDPTVGGRLKNLTGGQKITGKIIDSLFRFWA